MPIHKARSWFNFVIYGAQPLQRPEVLLPKLVQVEGQLYLATASQKVTRQQSEGPRTNTEVEPYKNET
jgi:hypothetical protein